MRVCMRVGMRVGITSTIAVTVAVRVREGDYFLTSHSISYTTAVIICDDHSKGWLGSGEGT